MNLKVGTILSPAPGTCRERVKKGSIKRTILLGSLGSDTDDGFSKILLENDLTNLSKNFSG